MNKKVFWIFSGLFVLILTACASNSGTPASASSIGSSADELSTQTKLILGAINLEETDYAITAEQAEELLPMFYVLQELNDSEAAAQEEMDGLVNQIQETLTKDQLQAIDDMSLSMQDMLAIMRVNRGNSSSSNASSTSSGAGGDFGAPPDMGGGMPGGPGGMPSTGTTSTSDDANAMSTMNTSTPSVLFDAAIELLQKKLGE